MKNTDLPYKDLLSIISNRVQEITFIFMVALVLFLLVALASYDYLDPAWSHTGGQKEISNAAGLAGAYISDFVLSMFGYFGYFVPIVIASIFATLYKGFDFKTYVLMFLLKALGGSLFLLSGCGLLNYYIPIIGKVIPNTSGGILGSFIEVYATLWVGKEGSTILLSALFMVGISLTINLSWRQIIIRLNDFVIWLFGKLHVIAKYIYKVTLKLIKFNQLKSFIIKSTNSIKNKLLDKLNHFIDSIKSKSSSAFNSNKQSKSAIDTSINNYQEPSFNIVSEELIDTKENINIDTEFNSNTEHDNLRQANNTIDKIQQNLKSKSLTKTNQNILPEVSLLEKATDRKDVKHFSRSVLEGLSTTLEQKLAEFGAEVKVESVYPGPVITRFELSLKAGLKVSKISALAKDLARSLSVSSVRVVEVIPGKSVIGLEIPNEHRETVRLREIVESEEYTQTTSPVALALGKDIAGKPVITDLAKMPHLLVAGTTGSGKSVGVNAMLLSMLYKSTPDDLRLILIDPKMLELSIYEGIPHLLAPVVTDMKDAANALRWCVNEMERRYQLMAAVGVRNLAGFNTKVGQAEKSGNPIVDPLWIPNEMDEAPHLTTLPRIVVIIDEFADMMMIVGKKVEELIARIAQKARAAGIHMILATQRPSVDVITGLIKANIPTRMAFQVSSKIDSRTILDQQGAEQLLGHGDMLFLPPGKGIPTRVHGAFVSDQEVHDVVASLRQQGEANYEDGIQLNNSSSPLDLNITSNFNENNDIFGQTDDEQDELFEQAVLIVTESKKTSVSNLQRRLKIGYNRAARLVEDMEAKGILSPVQPNGTRELLVGKQ